MCKKVFWYYIVRRWE